MPSLKVLPTIQGEDHEDIQMFLKVYEIVTASAQGDADSRQKVHLYTILANIDRNAKRYVQYLPLDTRRDLWQLHKALKTWYGERREERDRDNAISRLMSLRQGDKSVRDYVKDAKRIDGLLTRSDNDNDMLKRVFLQGLSDNALRKFIAIEDSAKNVPFKEAAQMVMATVNLDFIDLVDEEV